MAEATTDSRASRPGRAGRRDGATCPGDAGADEIGQAMLSRGLRLRPRARRVSRWRGMPMLSATQDAG